MKITLNLNFSIEKAILLISFMTLLSFPVFAQEQDQASLITNPDNLMNVGTSQPISYEPYDLANFAKDKNRYPAATTPKGSFNRHGELEFLDDNVIGIHWFVEVEGSVWHFVTAGNPSGIPVLMIHGFPETWHGFHKQMASLAQEGYYAISVDQLAYGQSDKSLKQDLTHQGVAKSLAKLLDKMSINRFNLISHDRGTCIADNMMEIKGLNKRVINWIRMQQSFDKPHGRPRPNHEMMAHSENYKDGAMITGTYNSAWVSVEITPEHMDRLYKEFGTEGQAEAVAKTYDTSFDKELDYRMKNLIQYMDMPILFLQGSKDPAQREEEYAYSATLIPDGHVKFVDANHFTHMEAPEEVSQIIKDFFSGKRPPKLIVD
ncbi:alpha/beta hydrolase [uncultured Aquimarina sp.]|uniref:alpha/beta fold hydrolase n=1 Tax=uncultured Aquimarina sp. TaxID=575652 RepID=UPI002631FB23|nr:alpha/beta hydrolase [uncultured Aquimarina sp.]